MEHGGNGQEGTDAKGRQFLTFRLEGERYGIDIQKVQEIVSLSHVTRVPRLPAFVRGVINLRGKVIPVVDLRLKFGLPEVEYTSRTCVIVTNIIRDSGVSRFGLIVDEVLDVAGLTIEQIDPPPALGAAVNTEFLVGIGKLEDGVVLLVEIEQLFSEVELTAVEEGPPS